MKVELTPEAARWVEDLLAAGRFATAEDAIGYAIDRVKLAELRAELAAAEAAGGAYDAETVRRYVSARLAEQPTSEH